MSATLVPIDSSLLPQVAEIFFESSARKTFKDQEDRDRFFEKYVGVYLRRWPSLCWAAVEDGKVLGYIVGSPTSNDGELASLQPHLHLFQEHFQNFPAHLHINCHREARGKGIGTELMQKWEDSLFLLNIKGLHIMTGADSVNQSFYRRRGHNFEVCKDFMGTSILFMGKTLRDK